MVNIKENYGKDLFDLQLSCFKATQKELVCEFECDSGTKCIELSQVCDNKLHCRDGKDEVLTISAS